MTAIVGGADLGLSTGSSFILGSLGSLGTATQGRSGETVSVNAFTGNLVLQRRDEFLAGLGSDVSIERTYNSQGLLSDDNGDNWRLSVSRRVLGLSGSVNTTGSTVNRISSDGAEVTYEAAPLKRTPGSDILIVPGGSYATYTPSSLHR